MQFVSSILSGSTPVQNLTWDPNASSMQICTTPELSSSVQQQELPRELQTPGKGIQQLMKQVQGDLDTLKQFIQGQETTVSELTQEVKDNFVHHSTQMSTVVATMEDNQRQLFKCIADNQQKMETEMDQWAKTTKRLIPEELNKSGATLMSEVHFLIQQFQAEVQQDLKVTFQSLKENQEQLTKEFHQCKTQMDDLCSDTKKFHLDLATDLQTQVKALTTSQPQPVASSSISVQASLSPVSTIADNPSSITKSDHLKLTFPRFGKPTDDTDPLNYLTRCQDFLALHPLAEADLLATFRTVLYGTARDWWEVARTSVFTWTEFKAVFLSAFLTEDYEDELAKRVRTRTQGENEPIRDFAFCYRALCKRWKSNLTESEIVKMILKNIKPHLASKLRSRVFTVEELVKLGHQLEKDYEQQKRYESSLPHKPQSVPP